MTVETTVTHNKATATVKTDDVKTAVEDVKKSVEEAKASGDTSAKAEVKLDVKSGNKDVKSVEVSVPADAMKAIADAKDVQLKLSSDTADITLDASTLAGIASGLKEGETLKITADVVDNSSALNEKQQELVGDNPVIEFSITAGDNKVSNFDGTVTVSAPYTPPVMPQMVTAIYLPSTISTTTEMSPK